MARRFDGSSGFVQSSADVTPALVTQAAWIRRYATPVGDYGIVGSVHPGTGANDKVLYLTVAGSSIGWYVFDGSIHQISAVIPTEVGDWVHAVATADGATSTLYLNGIAVASTAAGSTDTTAGKKLFIGRSRLAGAAETYFPGAVAHVATWNIALGAAEVARLYALAGRPQTVRPDALLVYYPLGYAGYEPDVWGSDAGGTLSGTSWLELDPPSVLAFGEIPLFAGGEVGGAGPDIVAPFESLGVGLYVPTLSTPIVAPFLSLPTGIKPANVLADGAPPFVPPSLPPTLGSGPAGGGATVPIGPGVPLPPLSAGGLAGLRFYQGPPWRWLVTDLDSNTLTFLDRLAAEVVVTYTLDKGWTAKMAVPSDNPEISLLAGDGDPYVSEGNRLLYGFRREGSGPLWQCRFAGKILQVEDSGETENARTIITAFDAWHLLYQRPMVNFDGDFPDTAGFFSFDDTQVGIIALTFLRNTIVNHDIFGLGIDIGDTLHGNMVGTMPGTSFWGSPYKAPWSGRPHSVYENTNPVDTDCQQGLSVGEVFDQQIDTGSIDIVFTPIYDPVNRPGYIAEMAVYEKVGVEADDAVFAWDKPSRNLRRIDRLKDGLKRANTIRYSWGQGGPPVNGGIPISYGPSILKYGETWHTQYWPGRIEEAVFALETLQLLLMEDGILTVQIEPAPERAPLLFTEWFLGDTVPEFASSRLRAPLAGFQRIYGVVLNIDENGYEQIPQVLVSPDQAS